MKLELLDTIEFLDQKITSLLFRYPTAKDMRTMPLQANMGDLIDLAARISNTERPIMERLSGRDTMRVISMVTDFLDDGPKTGESSAQLLP